MMESKTILELADKAGFNAPELEKGFANLLRQRLIDFANLVEAHDRLAQPEPEPVAWMYVNTDGECEQIEFGDPIDDPSVTLLYTVPPKREWVGLTHEQTKQCIENWDGLDPYVLCRELENKLKEKNT